MWREEIFSLDNFVVGSANEDAYNKVRKLVDPSCTFGLLFVIGNVGSGKTYLAKAAEMELLLQNKCVKRLTSDQFLGELIWHLSRNIENHGIEVFCKEYEKFDMLILDDIHFLEGKETTQQYFAYLLNRMLMKQKKILITSVKEIAEYQWFQEALRKNAVQMEQAHIQDADVELKKKILEHLQKKLNYELSKESEDLIAKKANDIRELEGYFKKLMAYDQLMDIQNGIDKIF